LIICYTQRLISDDVEQLRTVEHDEYKVLSSIANDYKIHLYKIGYICYFYLFLDKNVTDGTILCESVSSKYLPKHIIEWKGSLLIPINSGDKSKHYIEFFYATGKIIFKNPEANTCWGDFEKFWLLNRL
jgi:hypothetical protein